MWSRCAAQEVQSLISSIIFGPSELPSNALQWLNRNGLGFPKKSLFCFFRLFFYRSDMSIAHWASCSKIYNFGNGRLFLFICNFQCLRLCLCLCMRALLCLLLGLSISLHPSDQSLERSHVFTTALQEVGSGWAWALFWARAILSGFTLLSAFLSAQKSKTTQKRALKSKYAFLSAQKRAQTSGFAQKSAQLRSFAQKRAQLSGPLKKGLKRGEE